MLKKALLLTLQDNYKKILAFTVLAIITLFMLNGCQDEYSAQAIKMIPQVDRQLEKLKLTLNRGVIDKTPTQYYRDDKTLTNAALIRYYADQLIKLKPDLKSVALILKEESTAKGSAYQYLKKRFAVVNKNPDSKEEGKKALVELTAISTASDENNFNDSLLDTVNVLADLSDGQLPRIGSPANQDESYAKHYGIGSQYIGNPAYGHWTQDNQGNSFWEWYGKYAVFSSLFNSPSYYGHYGSSFYGGGAISYNNWHRNRGYSYYNDIGRGAYGSARDKAYYATQSKKYGKVNRYNSVLIARNQKKTAHRINSKTFSKAQKSADHVSKPRYRSALSSRVKAAKTGNFTKAHSTYASRSGSRFSSNIRSSTSRTSRTSGGFRGK